MIFYNSVLAKMFLGKKRHYFMLACFFFTKHKYLEVWEDMEMRIHARQYWECFSLFVLPGLLLSLLFSWWWMLLPALAYHLLFMIERLFCKHSVFNCEAIENRGDALYLRKRSSYGWLKRYGKKYKGKDWC